MILLIIMKTTSEKILLIVGYNMDYHEVKQLKLIINATVQGLYRISKEQNISISENDKNFYIFLIKHVIFFDYILNSYPETFILKVLISDFSYLIMNDMKQNDRYIKLHERSIIENYLRLILKNPDYIRNIDTNAFNELKDSCNTYNLNDKQVGAVHSAYKLSCSYIHGGKILEENLPKFFSEVFTNIHKTKKNKNIQNNRIIQYISYLDLAFITSNKEVVSNSFHRRKSMLDVLISKDKARILFTQQ